VQKIPIKCITKFNGGKKKGDNEVVRKKECKKGMEKKVGGRGKEDGSRWHLVRRRRLHQERNQEKGGSKGGIVRGSSRFPD